MDTIRIKFNVRGLVQGVGFRYFVYRSAMECNLTGFVKNLLDGSVSGVAEGPAESIATFKAKLRQGPTRSRVERVEVEEQTPEGNLLSFNLY